MNYTYTKQTKPDTHWILYILTITGWEAEGGTTYSGIHITMPRAFTGDYSNMATCPHITLEDAKGWVFHRYEKNKARKYPADYRLVKKGKTSYGSDVYPPIATETLLVNKIASDIATMTRP